jgi:hypothetical protein
VGVAASDTAIVVAASKAVRVFFIRVSLSAGLAPDAGRVPVSE